MIPALRRGVFGLVLLLAGLPAGHAADITDAAGRTVAVPDTVTTVYAAGPPAAVLIAVLAPARLAGWPMPLPDAATALLPAELAGKPVLERLTGRSDGAAGVQAIKASGAGLVIDYGSVAPRYAVLAQKTQTDSGVPYLLLDGALDRLPATFRQLGPVLGAADRAERLALLAERVLAQAAEAAKRGPHKIQMLRGVAGDDPVPADPGHLEVYKLLGIELGPAGDAAAAARFDPALVIVTDAALFAALPRDPAWRSVRAVAEGAILRAPGLPFSALESPPSANRLLGLAWLGEVLGGGRGHPTGLFLEVRQAFFGDGAALAASPEARPDGRVR